MQFQFAELKIVTTFHPAKRKALNNIDWDQAFGPARLGSLSKDDGNGNDNARKQCSDWLNEEK